MDEASSDESVCRDFLDIIHQRLYHLYFQCWSKYRLIIRVVEENNPIDKERLLCLIGLGEKELSSSMPDAYSLLRYTGILTQYPRSAMGLKTILRDALGMNNIRIIQNIRRMVPIPDDQRMRMLVSGRRLGMDTILGSKIADRTGRFRIRIGPLTWREFNDLLPGTPRNDKLTSLTRFYLTDPLEVELELILAAGEAQPIRIGDPEAKLGLNTWDFAGSSIDEVSALFRLETMPTCKRLPSQPDTAPAKIAHTFVDYYCRERQMLGEHVLHFVESHPNLAPMVNGPMADQGVEKLLEKTSFYNALLQEKINDDIPELIHEVMEDIQPGSLRPIPSTTIIAFSPKEGLTRTQVIPAGAEVLSIPVQGTGCRFRTCYDVTVHPLTLCDASFSQPPGQAPVISLHMELDGISVSQWRPKSLRFFLGDEYLTACNLYLLLTRYLERIIVTGNGGKTSAEIPACYLKPAGFGAEESVLPDAGEFLPGHRLIREYFLFPEKYLFLELTGFDSWVDRGEDSRFEIRFELSERPFAISQVTNRSFALFAVPAINLFPHEAEPLSFSRDGERQKISPAENSAGYYQVYSVERVSGIELKTVSIKTYTPCNPFGRTSTNDSTYYLTREKSALREGYDIFISPGTLQRKGVSPDEKMSIGLFCTNGVLPERLGIGDIRVPTADTPESVEIRNITSIHPALFPATGKNFLWRHLSNHTPIHLSLVKPECFRAVVRLYIPAGSRNQAAVTANEMRINGIVGIEAKPCDRLIRSRMVRGYEVRLKLRGDHFSGPGDLYLFCSVLERFLGGYVSENCFTRLVVEDVTGGFVFDWPVRMGYRHVL